jgi:hypothetical protein
LGEYIIYQLIELVIGVMPHIIFLSRGAYIMAKTISDFIVNRQDGLKLCKICQTIIENEEEHMKRRHPKYLQYLEKKEENEEKYMCCYCGLWVNNWREHVTKNHPEIIADAAKRVKPQPKEEEFEFSF